MVVEVKICGLTTAATVAAAVRGGAAYVGFNFFPPSPRSLEPHMARALAAEVPDAILKVGVFVDPDDGLLRRVLGAVPLNIVQLHGGESPDRLADIKTRFAVQVMKAIKVGAAADLAQAAAYEPVADRLMFDALPPAGADRPGGNAVSFDWSILAGRTWRKPWFLAGGIDSGNLAQAVAVSGAGLVDVSSGVERSPGVKDPAKIQAFLDIAGRL